MKIELKLINSCQFQANSRLTRIESETFSSTIEGPEIAASLCFREGRSFVSILMQTIERHCRLPTNLEIRARPGRIRRRPSNRLDFESDLSATDGGAVTAETGIGNLANPRRAMAGRAFPCGPSGGTQKWGMVSNPPAQAAAGGAVGPISRKAGQRAFPRALWRSAHRCAGGSRLCSAPGRIADAPPSQRSSAGARAAVREMANNAI
jgi:hypothetical protein